MWASVTNVAVVLAVAIALNLMGDVVVDGHSCDGTMKAHSTRLNDSSVLIGIVAAPDTHIAGTVTQFRVLVNSLDKTDADADNDNDNADQIGSVVDIRQATCCKDDVGNCHVWKDSTEHVICHGIDVNVDYRVTVVARGSSISPVTGDSHQVLVPLTQRSGHIVGIEMFDIDMNKDDFDQFQSNALKTLVDQELQRHADDDVCDDGDASAIEMDADAGVTDQDDDDDDEVVVEDGEGQVEHVVVDDGECHVQTEVIQARTAPNNEIGSKRLSQFTTIWSRLSPWTQATILLILSLSSILIILVALVVIRTWIEARARRHPTINGHSHQYLPL